MSDSLPPLADLDAVFDDTLSLPIGGKLYVIRGVDAEIGLYCQRLVAAGISAAAGEPAIPGAPPIELDDHDETALYKRLLGPVFDEMMSDGLSWPKIKLVGETVIFWTALGKPLAHAYWNSGGRDTGKALTLPAKGRQAAKRTGSSTVAARTTKKQGSTNITKSHRAK